MSSQAQGEQGESASHGLQSGGPSHISSPRVGNVTHLGALSFTQRSFGMQT